MHAHTHTYIHEYIFMHLLFYINIHYINIIAKLGTKYQNLAISLGETRQTVLFNNLGY